MLVWKDQVPPGGMSVVASALAIPSGRPTRFTGNIVTLGLLTVALNPLVNVPVYALPAPVVTASDPAHREAIGPLDAIDGEQRKPVL